MGMVTGLARADEDVIANSPSDNNVILSISVWPISYTLVIGKIGCKAKIKITVIRYLYKGDSDTLCLKA